MRDPYSVLGVQRNAGADEIKAAWRSKAKSVHPDHNQEDPSASTRFTEVGKAYEVLKDPERRMRYDRAVDAHQTIMQQRQAARESAERAKAARANAERVMEELARANAQRAQASANAQSGGTTEAAEDMIDRIFGAAPNGPAQGGASARPQPQSQAKPSTASATAEQDDTSAKGDGSRTDPQTEARPLPAQAVDLIASLVRRIRGTSVTAEKVPDHAVEAMVSLEDLLNLTWVAIKLPEDREVRLTLEAGMTVGHVARLKSQGLKVPGMQRGDLLVTLRIESNSKFRAEGFDIHTNLPISLEDAVLGTDTEIETPEGRRSISIPPWSGSDRALRLEGLGLLSAEGKRGDLVVELRVMLWEKPDAKVTDLMRHMREGLYL
ncbi:DnaJ domain-containing protein [Neorhizobium sp. T786]|uniref:DnaJ C-terminal domain-containing protein n=1 Tax=Pseudorhizobium xiangyangii TaxID=2883104 RepID=UPI001CFFAACB|nr:DnaJ C-terminal domain-containing protein [Neorhizobium xiangyangii]MCB5202996.1 DnaJ domain-containing protein [Neorhizobium xiangyangii]